jgi:hypothetical protein
MILATGACTVNLFTVVIVAVSLRDTVFTAATSARPSLIFVGKARSLPLEWSPVKGSFLEFYSFTCKYWTRSNVSGGNKHSSLLQCGNNYGYEKFYSRDPWPFYGRNLRIFVISKSAFPF